MFRHFTLIVAVIGAYSLLRGWDGAPSLPLRACFAVATLLAGLAFLGGGRGSSVERMRCLRRATRIDYLLLGAAVLLAQVGFVVFTSMLAEPMQKWATSFHDGVMVNNGVGSAENEDGEVDFSGKKPGNWLFKPNLERNLPRRSNHKPSQKPEVFIQLETAEDAMALLHSRIHLRAFCFSRFDGIAWSAQPLPPHELHPPISFPRAGRVDEKKGVKMIRHQIFHGENPTGQNIFTALSGAVRTDLASLTQLAEGVYQLPALSDHAGGYRYAASSSPVHFTDLIHKPITAAQAPAEYLSLPPDFEEDLKRTAESIKGEENLVSRLVALRSYLQDNYQYSLETTNARNENPLRNFLYIEKRGYCEHFATAAAMLARTLGVPSRIAYGWSGGKLYPSQNMFVFRAKDAHAWTEIKLEGYGWVIFDTTPPDDDAVPESHAAPESEVAPNPQDVIAEQYASQEADGKGAGMASLQVDLKWPMIALGVMGFCVLGFMGVRYFKQPETSPDGRPLRLSSPAYLLTFKQTCMAVGYPMPVGRTLRQQVEFLQSEAEPPEFLEDLLHYHYGVLYGALPVDPVKEKQLKQSMGQWKKEYKGESV